MIYEKVLEYQSKHNEGPMRYEMSSQANGETTDPASQESSSGLYYKNVQNLTIAIINQSNQLKLLP